MCSLSVISSLTNHAVAPMPEATHAHTFLPGSDGARAPIVLLHGSGGTEAELMPLADELAPGATRLGIRGTVPVDEGFAFFHRFPDRRVDEADISARAAVLAEFIKASGARYNLARRPLAIAFSNGAIMTAAVLLTHPGLLAGAILLRPLSPFSCDLPHHLNRTPVLILDGAKDSRRSPGDGVRLAGQLNRAGALVTHHVLPVGHSITAADRRIANEWLRATML